MPGQDKVQVIGDSSVLLTFAAVGRLDLLEAVFAGIGVPPAVRSEVTAKDFHPNRILAEALTRGTVLKPVNLPAAVAPLVVRYEVKVGRGESEAIALAYHGRQPVLLDDLAARRLAVHEGITVVGSLGILAACKEAGVILRVRPLAEAMRETGRFFGPALLRDFYRSQGEA